LCARTIASSGAGVAGTALVYRIRRRPHGRHGGVGARSPYGEHGILKYSEPQTIAIERGLPVGAPPWMRTDHPSTDNMLPDDVYQAVAYATRYALDRVALIFAEPPPVTELYVAGITVRLIGRPISHPT
jgi:hypothetical protein